MLWNARFGFFWYNDNKIFKFSSKDFKENAKLLADETESPIDLEYSKELGRGYALTCQEAHLAAIAS